MITGQLAQQKAKQQDPHSVKVGSGGSLPAPGRMDSCMAQPMDSNCALKMLLLSKAICRSPLQDSFRMCSVKLPGPFQKPSCRSPLDSSPFSCPVPCSCSAASGVQCRSSLREVSQSRAPRAARSSEDELFEDEMELERAAKRTGWSFPGRERAMTA